MKKLLPLALALAALLARPGSAQIQLSTTTNYTQDFNSLASTGTTVNWTNNTTLPGWYASRQTGGTFTTYTVSAGTGNAGALYSFGTNGVAPLTNRTLGSISSGTPATIAFGVRFQNDTAKLMTNVTLTFTGEQWRMGGNATTQALSFFYSVSSTAFTNSDPAGTSYTWTPLTSLDFKTPYANALPATGVGMDGHQPTNRQVFASVALPGDSALQPGQELFLRWVDLNDAGNDHGMGIDDLTVNFTGLVIPTNPPSITTPPAATTTANVWSPVSFTVVAAGTPPLTYRWYKDGVLVQNSPGISGATNATLTISSVLHTNAGNYTVVITNITGVAVSNDPPAQLIVQGFGITPVAKTSTLGGTPVSVSVNFVDNATPITNVTATSGSQTALPDADISITGSGNSRTITMSPPTGSNGVAVVTITAADSDGVSVTNIFPLLVVPNSVTLYNDSFDYADGPVTANSAYEWTNHSGTPGDLVVFGKQLYVNRAFTEDANALLLRQPWMTNSGFALYSKFTVNMAVEIPTTNGTYFAHFKDATTFGFGARVFSFASTNDPATLWRLAIGNGSGSSPTNGEWQTDLSLGVPYTVVTRFVLSNGVSTLWVNPTLESDPSVTANDISPSNALNVVSYAFRQNSGEGKMLIDDLVVGTSFAAVMGTAPMDPAPIPLNIALVNGQAVLKWTDPLFALASATNVLGPYVRIPASTSPYTNALTGSAKYFRLTYP